MAKIIAPNKAYNGVTAGVKFMDGKGETEINRLLFWFKEKGYEVEETVLPKKKSKDK